MYRSGLFLIAVMLLSISEANAAKLCKDYQSCAEVISDFPLGDFGNKDRDKDAIPCENVCRSRQQVEELLQSYAGSKKTNEKKNN
ncbi:hypothetical protein [Candidatus Nitrotoga sp. M5]|uniref:hypothetical protein n=1 Tax=Candidatus Nitrotoga sp. M5 TaxID=2890409 RepID=UPI001EF1C473|nr:hypothetical protein [Candidatus Nitrotoga sp. M5]CAH1385577.1 conserved exported hypothetical protein [Candidatus Nitrotoga sp. M5]